jgi:hypothetical protein
MVIVQTLRAFYTNIFDVSVHRKVITASKSKNDRLNNVRREASKHIKEEKREYLKDKINKLVIHSRNKNIRDLHRKINEFKRFTNLELTY